MPTKQDTRELLYLTPYFFPFRSLNICLKEQQCTVESVVRHWSINAAEITFFRIKDAKNRKSWNKVLIKKLIDTR